RQCGRRPISRVSTDPQSGLAKVPNRLVTAGSVPFVIVDPQFFPEDFAQDLNPKLGAEIAAEQRPRAWASSALHPVPPPGTRSRRGTQFRPTTAPSTLPCSGSWPSALGVDDRPVRRREPRGGPHPLPGAVREADRTS